MNAVDFLAEWFTWFPAGMGVCIVVRTTVAVNWSVFFAGRDLLRGMVPGKRDS